MTKLPVIPSNVPTADNTLFSDFEKCPRKYHWRHNLGWTPNSFSPALNFGGLMHGGLAIWYEHEDAERALDYMASADYVDVPGEFRTRGRAMTVMAEYVTHYQVEPWDKIILTETPFTIETPEGFRYGGKIDLVVVWRGGVWVVDHKTTTRGGPTYWNQFPNSPQMVGYVWAANQLTGHDIRGVIINRILVHKNPKPPEIMFVRRPFFYNSDKINEWYEMRVAAYHEMARCFENDHWRPRWDSCITKYGKCQYYDVCTVSDPEDRQEHLEAGYVVDFWDWEQEEDPHEED